MAKAIHRRTKIDLSFLIELNGGMAVGSGFSRGQIDRTVVRGLDGLPYIPASTLKGRVRDAAARLLNTYDVEICHGPDPQRMCGILRPNQPPCLLCRTFGTPGASSTSGQTGLIWRDAKPCDSNGNPVSPQDAADNEAYFYARTQVQLSRQRATALEKHLFTSENTIEGLHFQGRIRGWLQPASVMAGPFPAEVLLLLGGLKLLNFVGGGKSRGLGFCQVKLPGTLKIDDQDTIITEVLGNIGNLITQEEQ